MSASRSTPSRIVGPVPPIEELLARAKARNHGNRAWRGWKAAAAERFVDLARKAERMELHHVNLEGDLNLVYAIQMPVPRWPVDGRLQIGDRAVFHLCYQEDWRYQSPPGWAPLGLLEPLDPYHPNAKPSLRGAICLGTLQAGIQPKEIALLGYYALTLQDLLLDESDPNGVLNHEACHFFREHPEYIPLTDAGLYDPLDPQHRS